MTTYTSDSFTRGTSPLELSGSIADLYFGGGAQMWMASATGLWFTDSGYVDYRSTTDLAAHRIARLPTGTAGVYRVRATIAQLTQGEGGRVQGIVACYVDDTHYYVLYVDALGAHLYLVKMTPTGAQSPVAADATGDLVSTGGGSPSKVMVPGDMIGLDVNGTEIAVILNGAEVHRVTDRGTPHTSATVGLYGTGAWTFNPYNVRLGDITVDDIVPTLPAGGFAMDLDVAVAVAGEIIDAPPPPPAPTSPLDLYNTAAYYSPTHPPTPPYDYDRTFPMVGAGQLAQPGGVWVTRPGEVVPDLIALLFHRPDILHPIAMLDQSIGQTFQDRFKELGTGEVTLLNDDPDLASVWDHECVVRFEVQGRAAFCMIVNELEHVAIAEGEEHDQTTKLAGRAHISVLEECLVYPPTGADVLPYSDKRIFSWPSPDLSDSWWGNADILCTQTRPLQFPPWQPPFPLYDGGGSESYWVDAVSDDWPDPNAWWMWAHWPASREWAPEGTCYFRQRFTVPDDSRIVQLMLYAVIDDEGEVWFDGTGPIITAEYGAEPVSVYTRTVDITPGTHVIAIKATNGPPDPDRVDVPIHNPGGVLFAAYGINTNGEFVSGDPLVHSDQNWLAVEYPPQPPSFTVGEVIRHVIAEGQTRGCFPEVTLAFDDVFDSAGTPWPSTNEISTDVATNLWTFIGEELSATYVDVWMGPGDFTLYAWVHDGRGRDRPVTLTGVTDEHDPRSGNLRGLTHHQIR